MPKPKGPMVPKLPFNRLPFDLLLCDRAFPRVTPLPDEEPFTQALTKRANDLTPPAEELAAVTTLVSKVQEVLEKIKTTPPAALETVCQIEDLKQVGSLKKGTILKGHRTGDIVVVLKTLPLSTCIELLGNNVVEMLRTQEPQLLVSLTVTPNKGFEIHTRDAVVRVLIATVSRNLLKLDPKLHLERKVLLCHMAAIGHCRWFEENGQHATVKMLIRLLRDLKNKFQGLEPLHPWVLDLLAHYAIMNNPNRQALPINVAFRRALQLLSAGLLLQGSPGIVDPCETNGFKAINVMNSLTFEHQDSICLTAQTLVRLFDHAGFENILDAKYDLTAETTVWNNIVVNPLEKAYEKPAPKEEKMEAEPSAGQEAMETA